MKINSIKKTTFALALTLTVIAGAVNAVENIEQAKITSDASVSNTSENELTPFEEFLIVLGLKEEKEEGAVTLGRGIGECKTLECKLGKVKH